MKSKGNGGLSRRQFVEDRRRRRWRLGIKTAIALRAVDAKVDFPSTEMQRPRKCMLSMISGCLTRPSFCH
jgi:hypothetical protein